MVNSLKIVAIIQCRMSSSRLPAKAMLDLGGKTILERVIESIAQSSVLDEIWVATSEDILDDLVEWKSIRLGCKVFRGDLNDVLDRYCKCTKICHADIVVRITADNPLTHSKFIDLGVQSIIRKRCDYVAFKNIPYGSGVEVITQSALFTANEKSTNDQEREHVTLYILNNPIKFNINIIDIKSRSHDNMARVRNITFKITRNPKERLTNQKLIKVQHGVNRYPSINRL